MAFRCPDCGGKIFFDIDSQLMKCRNCGSTMLPEQIEEADEADKSDKFDKSSKNSGQESDLILFTCTGCGVELWSMEDSETDICPYCGKQSLQKSSKPVRGIFDQLIPFQISKERCVELFQKAAKKVWFLPGELKNDNYLQNFRGVYLPCYEYDVDISSADIVGIKTEKSNSEKETENVYTVRLETEGEYREIIFDASEYFNDEIASGIQPFDMDKVRPFREAYLSGFYAEKYTVLPSIYSRDAEEAVSKEKMEDLSARIKEEDKLEVDSESSRVKTHASEIHRLMLPVWLLAHRRGDRVTYSVVNGVSGKIVSDFPIDTRSFFLGSAVIAILLLIAGELFFPFDPFTASLASLAVGGLMSFVIKSSTERFYYGEWHLNDKGWAAGKKSMQLAVERPTGKKGVFGVISYIINGTGTILMAAILNSLGLLYAIVYAIVVLICRFTIILRIIIQIVFEVILPEFIDSFMNDYSKIRKGSLIFSLVLGLIVILDAGRVMKLQDNEPIHKRQPTFAILFVLIGVLLNVMMVWIYPIDERWYYFGDVVCMMAMIIASFFMIKIYSISKTRPAPSLQGEKKVRRRGKRPFL